MNTKMLLAGFGGQGILFSGKFIAYAGLLAGTQVSWLPSYGPEMRGGTARCSVILSDSPVGSPIVDTPDVLVAMNLPSLDKFEASVAPGGHIFVESSLISRKVERTDVTVHYLPATKMAEEQSLPGLANMIMAGAVLGVLPGITPEIIEGSMKKTVPERKQALFASNMTAVKLGMEFSGV